MTRPDTPEASNLNIPGTSSLSAWTRIHERIVSYRAETERIVGTQNFNTSAQILDLACGTGEHLIEAARLGYCCTGVDRQEWKLERARKDALALRLEIKFLCADMRSLQVAPVYDLVVCLYALSMMTADTDIAAVLETADRALRPGGSFVFNVLNKQALLDRDAQDPLPRSDAHLRAFDPDEIVHFTRQAGFVVHDLAMFDVAGTRALDIFVSARRATLP